MGGYDETLAARAGHTAVVCGDEVRTYRQLHQRASRLATVLTDEDLGSGDRLALLLPNSIELLECLAAAAKLEVATIAINWHLAPDELSYVLADSGAGALVAHHELSGVIDAADLSCPVFLVGDDSDEGYEARLAAATTDDVPYRWPAPWPVIYTSGTTGRPKGVVHGALADNATLSFIQTMLADMWGYTEDDIHIAAGPLYHAGPQGYASNTVFVGGTVVVMPEWDAREFCRLVQRHRATTTFLTPAHFIRILELAAHELAAYDLSSLRHVIHAGAPCPTTVKHRIMDALPDTEIWELYGASEGGATKVSPEDWRARPGTVGQPWPGTEIRILDADSHQPVPAGQPGLVYVKPSTGAFHYHDDPDKTDSAWLDDAFTVGDVGLLDEDGWLFLTDRAVDLVIKGGVNIYPRAIEEVLYQHPAIVDCAVFGVPHERDGEHLHAVVELRDDTDAEAILAFTREHLDPWSCPSTIEVVDELPRDPNGKVLKRQLRAHAWADAGRSI